MMGAKSDQARGRAKEATGIIIGDKDLESRGRSDRRAGEAEENIDHAKDQIEGLLDRAKDTVEDLIDKANDLVEAATNKAKDALHRK